MTRWTDAKIRCEDTWERVRREWEAGETGASLAQRYDVGLANLWRRRASEGWCRRAPDDPDPEPAEGWRAYARRREDEFERGLEEARETALRLLEAIRGGPLEAIPLWHAGFILKWRAEHLGAETAARDRAWASSRPWTQALWDEDGWLKDQDEMDRLTLEANRDIWREEMGLPEGAAENRPQGR